MTSDTERSRAFYTELFGWTAEGPADAAGFLPEGIPAHWSVYFGVDDTDAALARIVVAPNAAMPARNPGDA